MNAEDGVKDTALRITARNGGSYWDLGPRVLTLRCVRCMLTLLCFGAAIDEETIKVDNTTLLRPIESRLKLLRDGNRIGTSLMSEEERRFMWNLTFFFTIKHCGATAFKVYHSVRSFITYHGIFMGPGYDLGKESVWRKLRKQE